MQQPLRPGVLAFLLLSLVGCGGSQGSSAPPASPAAPAPAAQLSPSPAAPAKANPAPAPAPNQETGFGFSFGTYSLRVPGAVYETPIAGTDQSKLTISSGTTTASTLTLNPDGTYVWNSAWDGKVIKGQWEKTGDKGYPIRIKNGQEGKDWGLGKGDGNGKGDILLFDGNYMSYVGDRLK